MQWMRRKMANTHRYARMNLDIASRRNKLWYDNAKAKPFDYKVGSFVWYWSQPHARGKMAVAWQGPCKIQKVNDSNLEILESPTATKTRRIHVDQAKPRIGRER